MILNKLSKIIWYFKEVDLPKRRAVSYINFCIHSERLYDETIYSHVLKFAKDFRALTGTRITVCVSTPVCRLVSEPIIKSGSSQEIFSERVLRISEFAEIGYHGHFYLKTENGYAQVTKDNYDSRVVASQIAGEMRWLGSIGIHPKTYVAGWWFLAKSIVLELERWGIEVDTSVGKDKLDTFGGRYLNREDIPPYGEPFILPPSDKIVEIQSIFGPVMPPRIMRGYLAKYLKEEDGENLFFAFPLHDWDIPKFYRNIWSNVTELVKFNDAIRWMDIPEMRSMYLNKRTANK